MAFSNMRRLCAALAAVLIIVALCSCAVNEPQEAAPAFEAYMRALSVRDFSACYGMLTPESAESMTLSEFVSRHENLYTAMKLTKLTYESIGDGSYSIIYECEKLGVIRQEIMIESLDVEGETRVIWHPSMLLEGMEWGDRAMVYTLKPKRGEILDSKGNAFAINTFAETVYVDLTTVGDYDTCARALSPLTGMEVIDIVKIMSSERSQADGVALIRSYVPGRMKAEEREAYLAITGVGIDSKRFTPIRFYPQEESLGHTVGYATVVTAEDLTQLDPERYFADTLVGRSGLEREYEDVLTGYPGIELVIETPNPDSKGAYITKAVVRRIDVRDGLDLMLTVDFELQQRAQAQLSTLNENQAGSIIALDPKTGAILAQSSWPGFSANIFSDRDVAALYKQILESPGALLLNRTTQGRYPPGSTVKPFISVMALESGKFSLKTEFKGKISKRQWTPTISNWYYPPITRVTDYSPPYTMESAIVNSDNIYFANVALECGWSRVVGQYQTIGFDEAIDFDISVASPLIYNDSSRSNLRLLADMGYGQGELLITPLQMACLFSAFANDGDVMTPYIVAELKQMERKKYVTKQSFAPKVWRESILPDGSMRAIEPVLKKTIDENRNARISDIDIYGKTGTAELGGEREIAWIIAYVKGEGYERLVCVTLEIEADGGLIRYDMMKALIQP